MIGPYYCLKMLLIVLDGTSNQAKRTEKGQAWPPIFKWRKIVYAGKAHSLKLSSALNLPSIKSAFPSSENAQFNYSTVNVVGEDQITIINQYGVFVRFQVLFAFCSSKNLSYHVQDPRCHMAGSGAWICYSSVLHLAGSLVAITLSFLCTTTAILVFGWICS